MAGLFLEDVISPISNLLDRIRDTETAAESSVIVSGWLREVDRALLAEYYVTDLTMFEADLLEVAACVGGRSIAATIKRTAKDAAKKRRGPYIVDDSDDEPDAIDLPPGCPDLAWPRGYRVTDDGVFTVKATPDGPVYDQITYSPILITGRYQDIDTQVEQCEVSWRRGETWVSEVIPREQMAKSREIVALATTGAPIDDGNARAVVRYLSATEATNLAILPLGLTSSRMGWLSGGRAFLAGDRLLGDQQPRIRFRGEDGIAQMADAYQTRGTLDGWLGAVDIMSAYPLAYVAMYAALAAPLMHVIPACPNFLVHWSSRPGSGKTSSLRAGGSIWGDPSDTGLIGSWDSSATWIERAAATANYLPLLLDETSKVDHKDRGSFAQTVYILANGKGRGRGSIRSTQRQASWRGITLSTGESRITEHTRDGGVRARVISLTGYPLGKRGAERSESLTAILRDHHGHLGPMAVEWLIKNRENWPKIREEYERKKADLADTAITAMSRRLAQYVALLAVAADMMHVALGIPRPAVDPIEHIWDMVQLTSCEADQATEALRLVYDWASSNPLRFHDPSPAGSNQNAPYTGWAGSWSSSSSWDEIAFVRSEMDSVLSSSGMPPDAAYAEWDARGWIVRPGTDATGDAASKHRRGRLLTRKIGGRNVKCIVVRRSALYIAGIMEDAGRDLGERVEPSQDTDGRFSRTVGSVYGSPVDDDPFT